MRYLEVVVNFMLVEDWTAGSCSCLIPQLFLQATSQATQMVKSKSMEVVQAVQGDLNEVRSPFLQYFFKYQHLYQCCGSESGTVRIRNFFKDPNPDL
jgi:hypothetical protein